MNSDGTRRTAGTVGALFIVATAPSLLGTAIERPVFSGVDYLTRISENLSRVSAGGLLELVAAWTSVGIAIALYPVLKRWSVGLALGAAVFRAIEAVMYTAAAVSMLSLQMVSQQFATPGPRMAPRSRRSATPCSPCVRRPSWPASPVAGSVARLSAA